jgi:hypothetical protein
MGGCAEWEPDLMCQELVGEMVIRLAIDAPDVMPVFDLFPNPLEMLCLHQQLVEVEVPKVLVELQQSTDLLTVFRFRIQVPSILPLTHLTKCNDPTVTVVSDPHANRGTVELRSLVLHQRLQQAGHNRNEGCGHQAEHQQGQDGRVFSHLGNPPSWPWD